VHRGKARWSGEDENHREGMPASHRTQTQMVLEPRPQQVWTGPKAVDLRVIVDTQLAARARDSSGCPTRGRFGTQETFRVAG